MRELELQNAYNKCLIDDDDYEKLSKIKLYVNATGHVRVCINGKMVGIHRNILNVMSKRLVVDHIDGNPLNNQKHNLRICEQLYNSKNKRINKNNTSGYKGVHFSNNYSKWCSTIKTNYKNIFLGHYKTKEEAVKAYDNAVKKYHGEFGVTNLELKERKPIEILWKPTKFEDSNLKPEMIPLGHYKYAYVDLEDYKKAMQHSWSLNKDGYAQTKINRKNVSLHRFILSAVNLETDHIDRNKLNCRRKNLRLCSHQQNCINRKYPKRNNKYRGIYSVRNKWRATIKVNGKIKHLGYFSSKEDAAKSYDVAAIRYFGEFAITNFKKELLNEK